MAVIYNIINLLFKNKNINRSLLILKTLINSNISIMLNEFRGLNNNDKSIINQRFSRLSNKKMNPLKFEHCLLQNIIYYLFKISIVNEFFIYI
jgi:hypothetical protein